MTQTQHTDEPSVDDVYSRDVPAEMLNSPVFEAVWSVVKHWDVGVPAAYGGYCAGNGSHVAAIVNALARLSHPTLSADRLAEIQKRHDTVTADHKEFGKWGAVSYADDFVDAHADRAELLSALKQ